MEDQGIDRKYLEFIHEDNNEDNDIATKSTLEVLTEITKLQQALKDKVTACDLVSAKSLKFNREVQSPSRLYL